jgi:glycolate oxidase FAD binding subunit
VTGGLAIEGPGVLPALAAPRSAAELAGVVRDAAARGTRLRLVGGGTWLDAGHPVAADAALPLGALRGVVDYVPGDLTLTARAGTPLAELAAVTRAEGQFVPLDPAGAGGGTLGATVATASAGPLAHALGRPRDLVLGAEFVTGAGDVVRAGGRVVKNVAGFDLVRLATGAWGTLGALTEVSVRLRALPEVDATVAVALPPAARLADWLERLRALPLAAWALELVNAPLTEQVGGPPGAAAPGGRGAGMLLARLAGNAALVAAQRAALAALGDPVEVDPGVWARLGAAEPRAAVVLRRAARPTALAGLCAEPFSPAAAAFGLRAHAAVGRGVVRIILPGDTGFGLPSFGAAPSAGGGGPAPSLVVERLPAGLWPTLGARLAPGRARDPLSRRVRAAFDPGRILNPGVLGELD